MHIYNTNTPHLTGVYNRVMNPEQIYSAISPSWFTLSTPNNWNTSFYSTVIIFDTQAITGCEYTISSPYQTGGLNSGINAPTTQTDTFIDNLRYQAANRLHTMHTTNVTGYKNLDYVYNSQA